MDKKQLLMKLKSDNFNEKIINAFEKVKRENFIPSNLKSLAYEDEALPLEKGATISQPYTIAFMLNLLELKSDYAYASRDTERKSNSKILEIGSGSGYVLALLAEISKNSEIYGVEIISSLADKSIKLLSNYRNIKIFNKDGFNGLQENAPFDRILASASAQKIPSHLFKQLKNKGIIVCPVKNSIFQIKKINNRIKSKEFPGFVFVPLVKSK